MTREGGTGGGRVRPPYKDPGVATLSQRSPGLVPRVVGPPDRSVVSHPSSLPGTGDQGYFGARGSRPLVRTRTFGGTRPTTPSVKAPLE